MHLRGALCICVLLFKLVVQTYRVAVDEIYHSTTSMGNMACSPRQRVSPVQYWFRTASATVVLCLLYRLYRQASCSATSTQRRTTVASIMQDRLQTLAETLGTRAHTAELPETSSGRSRQQKVQHRPHKKMEELWLHTVRQLTRIQEALLSC